MPRQNLRAHKYLNSRTSSLKLLKLSWILLECHVVNAHAIFYSFMCLWASLFKITLHGVINNRYQAKRFWMAINVTTGGYSHTRNQLFIILPIFLGEIFWSCQVMNELTISIGFYNFYWNSQNWCDFFLTCKISNRFFVIKTDCALMFRN